jgi:hypothetical protein
MAGDQPARDRGEDPAGAAREPAAGSPEAGDGGDPACWACLVCQECGAVISEGHGAGCSQSAHPARPLRDGS